MTIGSSLPRLEDRRLTTGNGRYTSDYRFDNEAHAVFVRADRAHAKIIRISKEAALEAEGVIAVFSAADYAQDGRAAIPHNAVPPDAVRPEKPGFVGGPDARVFETDQPPLVADLVRCLGEAVVMVVAETLALARDAAELVEVEYEELDVVVGIQDALGDDAPLIWPELGNNIALQARFGDPARTEECFKAAHLVIEREFANQRIVACQMEPRSAIGLHDEIEDHYTVYAGNQGAMRWRTALARALRRAPEHVRVVTPDVGGGFGPRTSISPEAVLVTWAASQVGRPVRWVSDRTESFLTDYQGRDIFTRTALAFDRDGRILAMRQTQIANIGAYPVSYAPLVNSHRVASTVYSVPTGTVSILGVLTNTVPTVPYRGAGRPEVTFAMERVLDMAAPRLGLDRLEIRRRNLLAKSQLPYDTFMGLRIDSGAFHANMERAAALSDWQGAEQRKTDSRSRGRLRGIGLANYMETPVGAPREKLEIRLMPDGVELVTGTQSTGQGHETTYAQVVSSLLGIDYSKVKLVTGDTHRVSVGGGTHSDRSMRLVGTLLVEACNSIVSIARERAAQKFGTTTDRLRFADGVFSVEGSDLTVDIAALSEQSALVAQAELGHRLPAYPTGCAVCELEIDPETGETEIVRYSSVDDVGQAINPLIVDGQVHGGIAQGIGQALHEQFNFDPETGQAIGASFMDYCLPRADMLPDFDVELAEDPTTLNPLRIGKGGGEGGITPAIAAVIGAVADALSSYGIEHIEMPATAARIWEAIDAARAASDAA